MRVDAEKKVLNCVACVRGFHQAAIQHQYRLAQQPELRIRVVPAETLEDHRWPIHGFVAELDGQCIFYWLTGSQRTPCAFPRESCRFTIGDREIQGGLTRADRFRLIGGFKPGKVPPS